MYTVAHDDDCMYLQYSWIESLRIERDDGKCKKRSASLICRHPNPICATALHLYLTNLRIVMI